MADAGERLAALGLPDTLWHNDLHTNNVFDTREGLVFFDLGDALAGSPLRDLLIPLRFFAHARGGEFGAGQPGDYADASTALLLELVDTEAWLTDASAASG